MIRIYLEGKVVMKFNVFVKKTLSVVLSLAVLAAGLVVGTTSMAAVGSEIWDGTLKEPTLCRRACLGGKSGRHQAL